MVCQKCGNILPDEVSFCNKCGTPTVNNVASQRSNPVVVTKPESIFKTVKILSLCFGIPAVMLGSLLLLGVAFEPVQYSVYITIEAVTLILSGLYYIILYFLSDEVIIKMKFVVLGVSLVNMVMVPFGTILSIVGFINTFLIHKQIKKGN